ncbi:MAG: GtrA family protein [Caulobacteraceae bacterium]
MHRQNGLTLDRHGSEEISEILRARRFDRNPGAMKDEVFQIGRYGLVGGSAALSYVGVVLLFSGTIGALGAAILAQIVATAISYLGHRTFTFRSSTAHRQAIPRFLVATAASVVVNLAVTGFASSVLRVNTMMTSVMAICAIIVVSYASNRLWTFKAL